MTIQLNDLKEIGKEIREQDNMSTQNPIFILFEREKVPTDRDYSDEYIYVDGENEFASDEDLLDDFKQEIENNKELKEALDNRCEWDCIAEILNEQGYDQISKVHYLWKQVFKQAFFTKKSAEAYLEENKHHFQNPLIYCHSLWRNEEMKTIRNYLIGDEE